MAGVACTARAIGDLALARRQLGADRHEAVDDVDRARVELEPTGADHVFRLQHHLGLQLHRIIEALGERELRRDQLPHR